MKIIINASNLSHGGGLQVAISFIEMCRGHKENEYIIFLSPTIKNQLSIDDYNNNFHFFLIKDKPLPYTLKGRKSIRYLRKLEKNLKPDCVFTVFGPTYWTPFVPHFMGFALGHFIYEDSPFFDLISIREKILWRIRKRIKMHFVKQDASYYHVETEDAKARLSLSLKCSSDNIFVFSNTYNIIYENFKIRGDILPKKKEGEFRFIYISAYYKHKNFEILNQIIPVLKRKGYNDITFILTIEEQVYEEIFTKNAKSQILNIGPVKVEDCPQLYYECDAVFVPSVLEIFTANYPEAMKMSKPILTTNLSSAKTICENAALYFDALNYNDAVDKVVQLVQDKTLQNQLITNGNKRLSSFLTPHEKASEILQICQSIINH